MPKKGFTLIEMIVVSVIVGFVVISFTMMSLFFIRQVNTSRERTNMYSQLDYTLSDIRLRCISAVTTATPLQPVSNITIDHNGGIFAFNGEADIYNITPDDTTDNVDYAYEVLPVDDPANPGSLVLNTVNSSGVASSEVLIDGRYQPRLVFAHHCSGVGAGSVCDEPHFITITVSLLEPIENINIIRIQ